MFIMSKAFSSFSVNDIQKAREFYGRTSGSKFQRPEGALVVPLSAAPGL
jgi:extradiol dioxygenase family protein